MRSSRNVARFVLVGWLAAALGLPQLAWASSETDALINKLVEKKILTVEEAQEVRNDMAKDAGPIAKAQEADTKDTVKKMAGGSWLNTVKWSGDFRLRHETQFRDPAVDRARERMRLRFGFTAKPVDPLLIGVKLGTGASGDPLSSNQSFTSTFDKKAIFLDQAYAKYTPWSWLSMTGGKMPNPYQTTDLVWDPDVTPEGFAVQLKSPSPIPGLAEVVPVKPFATVGYYVLTENSTKKADPGLLGFQGGADVDLPWGISWQPSVADYFFTSLKKRSATSQVAGAPAGNTTVTENGTTKFKYEFNVLSFLNRVTLPEVFGHPVALVADYAYNPEAPVDNTGWQIGTEVGKVTEKFGSWKAFYYYKRLKSDAVFGALTDSDFGAGGTNHRGHMFGAQMGLNKYASMGVKYLRADGIDGTPSRNNTLQVDLQTQW